MSIFHNAISASLLPKNLADGPLQVRGLNTELFCKLSVFTHMMKMQKDFDKQVILNDLNKCYRITTLVTVTLSRWNCSKPMHKFSSQHPLPCCTQH